VVSTAPPVVDVPAAMAPKAPKWAPLVAGAQSQFASNWELSSARATTVVRALEAAGVPPDRLAASGRAEYSPVASNDDPDGRKRNRRIEITLIDKNLAQELQTSPK